MKLIKSLFFICCLAIFSCSSNEENIDTNGDENLENPTNEVDYETQILNLLNKHRTDNGLAELAVLDIIKTQTEAHTDYMIGKGDISHDNFSDRSDFLQQNADARSTAENVAFGYNNAQSLVNAWINSDGHRRNIEGNFTHFNITAKQNKNGAWYYTNIFIRR
ncbi:CAP domain-containing protein [Tenacibaculum jejuense]|uniref:Probable lipoprotein n=1 Tax=Tenacibaculum jejuense TaxID=584609 RepID=A0A238UAW4_9FLAO|nr:CAP domain-containing protein [Tenacibaculum jejuense]SNR16232.1 Probable lipoprotein precursor [Tenacibaculum jejuense]